MQVVVTALKYGVMLPGSRVSNATREGKGKGKGEAVITLQNHILRNCTAVRHDDGGNGMNVRCFAILRIYQGTSARSGLCPPFRWAGGGMRMRMRVCVGRAALP
jgi:hypothetical protein